MHIIEPNNCKTEGLNILKTAEIAPYEAILIPVNINDEEQMKIANELYTAFQKAGIEVLMDDRDERAGVKFKDSELIGFPIRITVGKTISEGLVEYKTRKDGVLSKLTPQDAVKKAIADVKENV